MARAGEDFERIDAADWAESALRLLRDPGAWLGASQAGRLVAAEHTWSNVLDHWETMLSKLELD